MRIIFVLVVLIVSFSSVSLLAEENKTTEANEKVFIMEEKVHGAGSMLNQVLEPLGLQFTPGGVRPAESLPVMYPTIGDVILLTPKQSKAMDDKK